MVDLNIHLKIAGINVRLKADNNGVAKAGVDRLRRIKKSPQEILKATIDSAFFAVGMADIKLYFEQQEKETEKNAQKKFRGLPSVRSKDTDRGGLRTAEK